MSIDIFLLHVGENVVLNSFKLLGSVSLPFFVSLFLWLFIHSLSFCTQRSLQCLYSSSAFAFSFDPICVILKMVNSCTKCFMYYLSML